MVVFHDNGLPACRPLAGSKEVDSTELTDRPEVLQYRKILILTSMYLISFDLVLCLVSSSSSSPSTFSSLSLSTSCFMTQGGMWTSGKSWKMTARNKGSHWETSDTVVKSAWLRNKRSWVRHSWGITAVLSLSPVKRRLYDVAISTVNSHWCSPEMCFCRSWLLQVWTLSKQVKAAWEWISNRWYQLDRTASEREIWEHLTNHSSEGIHNIVNGLPCTHHDLTWGTTPHNTH